MPHLASRLSAPDWGSDPDAASFIASMLAYGAYLMKDGYRNEAAHCLRFLIRLDPGAGAAKIMVAMGLVGPGAAPDPGVG